MAEFKFDNLVSNLPDSFAKSKDSNNYKLLATEKYISDIIYNDIQDLFNALDIDNASGKVLDMYGGRLGINRGAMTDEQYLIMLKAKIAQNLSDGTRESISNVLSFILECQTADIQIRSGTNTGEVIIENIPLLLLINAGFDIEQIIGIVNIILPVGVKVASHSFSGTFEFGSAENEYDQNKGFADDDMTIGGYFGIETTMEQEAL